jgi:hypothetical protein
MCQTGTDLGINKGSGRFLNFSGAPTMVLKLMVIAKRKPIAYVTPPFFTKTNHMWSIIRNYPNKS